MSSEQFKGLAERCAESYKVVVSIDDCINAWYKESNLEREEYTRCHWSQNDTFLVHNTKFMEDCGGFEIFLLKYAVPPLMLFCILGNFLNLMIYRLSYFDGSSSVHFLRAKALANMIFVVIHAWQATADPVMETLFWKTRAYIITISNISGTLSTWLTLMVTVETVLCVMVPFVFRQYCTKRMTYTVLVISSIIATLMHATFIVFRTTNAIPGVVKVPEEHCFYRSLHYSLDLRGPEYLMLQKIYLMVQMALVIVIPTIAMLICTAIIVKQFTLKDLGEAFSQRRKCVIRLTVATTLSHLLLEGPATLTHAAVAIDGSSHQSVWCVLLHINNLLSLINATIPFFVFFVCADQFRHMTEMYLLAMWYWKDSTRRHSYLTQAGMRPRNMRYTGTTEVTMVDTHLISKVSKVNSMNSV